MSAPAWTLDSEYQKLNTLVSEAGLLQKTPYAHLLFFLAIVVLQGVALYAIRLTNDPLLLVCIAAFFAFPRAWAGYLGHDIAHGEVFNSKRMARVVSSLCWALFLGVSAEYWTQKHNMHHTNVNQIGKDPDFGFPAYFSKLQREDPNFFQKNFSQALISYQQYYFFALFPFLAISFYFNTLTHIFSRPLTLNKVFDLLLIITHFALLYGYVFLVLGTWNGVLFIVVNALISGTLLSLAFAPNHKGQIMIARDAEQTWVHQVVATRNLSPTLLVTFLYGGLNFQIEHHLFPHMSRFKLRKARPLIKKFCEDRNIEYYETTPMRSLQEIYQSLRLNARPS